MVPLTAVIQTTWEPLHGQKADTITSNSSSGRRTQKTPAPDDPTQNGCVAIRLRLKEALSVTISLAGLA